MAVADVTLDEVKAVVPAGPLKTLLDQVPGLPPDWTYSDFCSSMIQAGVMAQAVKNQGVTVTTDRLNSYSVSASTPTNDPATGVDSFRRTSTVTVTKQSPSFDATLMQPVGQ